MVHDYVFQELSEKTIENVHKELNKNSFLENKELEKELVNRINILKKAIKELQYLGFMEEKYDYHKLVHDSWFIEDITEDSFFQPIVEELIEEAKTPIHNKFILYTISFFYEINSYFEIFYNEYHRLVYEILPQYYYLNDKNLDKKIITERKNDEKFDLDEYNNINDEFFELTSNFLANLEKLYKKFMKNIFKYLDVYFNLMLITKLYLRFTKCDDLLADNINQIFYFLAIEVDDCFKKMSKVRKLNETLRDINHPIINRQYNEIRKLINRYRKRFGDVRFGGSGVYSYY